MKKPFFMTHIRGTHGEHLTIGDEVAVKMSQRTLIYILGVALAAGVAYADLKSDARTNSETVKEISVARALDHDVLIKVATGVEQLQRSDARRDFRDTRGSTSSTSR